MKDLKIFLKQTVYYGLSSVIARVLNFLLVPLYTYIFIPEQYGIISEMYAYAVFIMILSTLSIETAFFKFSNKPTIKDNVASNSSFLLLVSSTILILLAIFFVDPISKIIGGTQFTDYRNYIFYFLIILSVDTLCVIPFAQLRLKEKARRFATVKVINILVNILFNLYFYLYLGYTKIDYVFISNLLSSIVTFLILAPSINNFSFDLQLSKKMMKYSFPLIIAGFAYAVNETADKILIKNLTNQNPLEQLGIYSACYKLSIFMILFIQAFRLAAEPLFFNYQKKTNSKKIYAQLMRFYFFISMLLFLMISLNIDYLKLLISDSSYHTGLHIIPIILLGHICLGAYYNLSLWYKLTDQTKYGAYISIFGCIITLSVNIIFLPTYGYISAAWATFLCYISMMLISFFLGKKKYPIPYNVKSICLYIILALVIFCMHQFYSYTGILSSIILIGIYIICVIFIEGWYKKLKLVIK